MRRSSVFHASLHRPKLVMGMDPLAFYVVAGYGSVMFAVGAYPALLAIPPLFAGGRLMSKKDPHFMGIFLKYLDQGEAYSSIPRPGDWTNPNRPVGWGRGLPW